MIGMQIRQTVLVNDKQFVIVGIACGKFYNIRAYTDSNGEALYLLLQDQTICIEHIDGEIYITCGGYHHGHQWK